MRAGRSPDDPGPQHAVAEPARSRPGELDGGWRRAARARRSVRFRQHTLSGVPSISPRNARVRCHCAGGVQRRSGWAARTGATAAASSSSTAAGGTRATNARTGPILAAPRSALHTERPHTGRPARHRGQNRAEPGCERGVLWTSGSGRLQDVEAGVGHSAAGIRTDPSACCPCSRIATSVRPIGSPELFSVAANPRLPSAARVRMPARRAWNVAEVRRRRDLPVLLLPRQPHLEVVGELRREADVARRELDHPVGQPEALQHGLGVRRRAAPARRATSPASTIRTSSTLLNSCIRMSPRVSRPYEPASDRKHGVCAV